MMEQQACLDDALTYFESHGISLPQFVNYVASKKTLLLALSDKQYIDFSGIYAEILANQMPKNEKGRKFELLVRSIISPQQERSLFKTYHDIRTSTNEIDFLASWSDFAKLAGLTNSFECFNSTFLCECKNYERKIDVTYIGKFFSLLNVSHAKIGIIFSKHGFSGRSQWSDGKGLVRKLALRNDVYILDFNLTDFKNIFDKQSTFIATVCEKYEEMKNDIRISAYISSHASESSLRQLMTQ